MAAKLCLAFTRYQPPPKPVCNLSTSITNARGDELHFRLNHTSPPLISTSEYKRRGQTRQHFQPVFCHPHGGLWPTSGKDENDNESGSPGQQQKDLGPSLDEVNFKIIGEANRLMAEGKLEEAEKFLVNKYNEYEEKQYSQVLNDVDLALVKVLIKLKKYAEASTRKCLEDEQFTRSHPDALLYKAGIFVILGMLDDAIDSFKQYEEAVQTGLPKSPPA